MKKTASQACWRAALYIRLSKEDEHEGPSQSVQNQEALLRDFIHRQGLQLADVYIDDGWSGTNFDRPAFRRMLADIEAGLVNMVITKDLSRLGRDYILTGHYMERYFPEHQVRYISLLDGIDTGVDSTANEITPFRAILNDMYAKDISKKIKSVKRDKQRRGLFIGGKPVYGYRMHPSERNRLVIDEQAAPTVRRIFAMALTGLSCRAIAARLNEDCVPSPAAYAKLPCGSGRWSGERISELLRNETYLGNMVQGRSLRISYKSPKCRRQAPEDWIIVPGTHEPLIDAQSFQAVQALLRSRRHTRSRRYDFLLKGLIYCHECGAPLGVVNRKTASGEDRLYLICRSYQRAGKAGPCSSHCIREPSVTAAVLDTLKALYRQLPPDFLLPLARDGAQPQTDAAALQRRGTALTAQLDRLYEDRLSGLLAEADFIRHYRRLQQERSTIEAQLCTLQRETSHADETQAQTLVERFLKQAPCSRALLVRLIERIELTEDRKLILRLRFSSPQASG